MLTLEENGWHFKSIKIYSILNVLPIQIDMKTKKIGRQSSKIRIFIWQLLFWLGISYCFYLFGRLIQSTVVEPEKYFRWDHFILHGPWAVGYSLLYYTGFSMFVGNPEECVLVFNQLFVQKENPVQKMMDQEEEEKQELEQKWKRTAKAAANRDGEPKKNPDRKLNVRIFSGTGSSSGSTARARPLLTWPPQYSLDELLAKTFPLIIEPTNLFALIVLAVDPSRPQLLYSSLPLEWQNWCSFLGLLAAETIFLKFIGVFAVFSVVCQLLFFSKCQAEFKRLDLQLRNLEEKFQRRSIENRDFARETWILRHISKDMRQLVLFIELFNRCFPPCIFAWKLFCLSVCILFYFFTIRHGADLPFLALFTGYIACALTLIYAILYEKAFSVPEKMTRLKREIIRSAHKTSLIPDDANRNFGFGFGFRAEMKREIGAIQDIGVKVGGFHTLERQSTPNFIDFVVNQVVSLLVTFP